MSIVFENVFEINKCSSFKYRVIKYRNPFVQFPYGPFTPKRTKSQFRAVAWASSKQVPALSQL
jgi:hypothetical protein